MPIFTLRWGDSLLKKETTGDPSARSKSFPSKRRYNWGVALIARAEGRSSPEDRKKTEQKMSPLSFGRPEAFKKKE